MPFSGSYYTGSISERLTPEMRRPDVGSRVQGLAANFSYATEDLAKRQSMYAQDRVDMEYRLSQMQAHVEQLRREKEQVQDAWWSEKEALLAGWSGDYNRLMMLYDDAGLPRPAMQGAPPDMPPAHDVQAMQLAGDHLMNSLVSARASTQGGFGAPAMPERRAAEYRVRALEVQLAREDHARRYAYKSCAEQGIFAFDRPNNNESPLEKLMDGTTRKSRPLGDLLGTHHVVSGKVDMSTGVLGQTENEALKARVSTLQARVAQLEEEVSK